MAITFELLGRSGTLNADRSQQSKWKFFIKGAADDVAAQLALFTHLESTLGEGAHRGSLQFWGIDVEERVTEGFEATANWKNFGQKEAGESEFSFELALEPVKVIIPVGSIAVHKAAGAPDITVHLIGDKQDGKDPEGCEIFEPTYSESTKLWLPAGSLTQGYTSTIKNLVGRTNTLPFKGHQPGEVLLMGVSGSRRSTYDWELSFKWSIRPNQLLTVAGISGISKKGWQYLWPVSKTAYGGSLGQLITHVCVATVFESGDLNLLQV